MKLPPKVHQKGPSLYYVDKNKWIRLCAADAPEHVMHGELWNLLRKGVDWLANDGYDTRAIQHYLGHRNIQHTVKYTEMSAIRFKNFWDD